MSIREIKGTFNPALFIVSTSFKNDDKEGATLNLTIENLAEVVNAIVYLKIKLPLSDLDDDYGREFVTTTIRGEKALKGIYSNPILKTVMDGLTSKIDFELKFPFKKVSVINN